MYTYVIIDDEPLIRRGTKKKLEPLSHLLTCCGRLLMEGKVWNWSDS
ncbi:MAG: hypothetical protein ACLTX3_11150 [Lachnospiraceae bacterium]